MRAISRACAVKNCFTKIAQNQFFVTISEYSTKSDPKPASYKQKQRKSENHLNFL